MLRQRFAFPAFAGIGLLSQQTFITIGTGGVTGVYDAVAGAVCRLMNKDRARTVIRCSVESIGGSVSTSMPSNRGSSSVGMTQSDAQYNCRQEPAAVQE